MKLEELGLSYDEVQLLKRYGCSCIDDLTKLTLEELNERMQYPFQPFHQTTDIRDIEIQVPL